MFVGLMGIAGLMTICVASSAQSSESILSNLQAERRGPPPQAFEACTDKAEGDSCQFEGRHGLVEGVCKTRKEQLVCVPDRGKKPRKEEEKEESM